MYEHLTTFLADTPWLADALGRPLVHSLLVLAGFLAVASLWQHVAERLLTRITRRTKTHLDEVVIHEIVEPVALSFALAGLYYALFPLDLPQVVFAGVRGLIATSAVLVWSGTSLRLGTRVLGVVGEERVESGVVQNRTLPLFDIAWKAVVLGLSIYFFFLSWSIDVTAWLASAGIVGVAVGFAAQETLGNLFAGVAVLTDGPYKLGDFLVLEDGTRGRVTEVGLRSTRLLTPDDVEVVVPNSVMAGARIYNESGGPYERERVSVTVQVSYPSDLDRVRQVLLGVAPQVPQLVLSDPRLSPHVRFRSFDDSGISVSLLGWIERPELREAAVDTMIVEVHRALREAGIEIPFPQLDLMVKELPRGEGAPAGGPAASPGDTPA